MTSQKNGRKFVRARCQTDSGNIILTIDNSMDDEPPHPVKGRRGVGLSSVAAVAEKYEGSFRFEPREREWQSSALLMCRIEGSGESESN